MVVEEISVTNVLLSALLTVAGSGMTAYVAIRVALAEQRGEINQLRAHILQHCREFKETKEDVHRLESAVFVPKRGG